MLATEHFNYCTQQAAWNATPPTNNIDVPIKCSKFIRDKIQEKRKVRKLWQTFRSPLLKTKLNKIIKELKTMLREDKNTGIQSYLMSLSPTAETDYSLSKTTRRLKQPQRISPPVRREDGSWARCPKEKANTFATYLSKVFVPNPREISHEEEEEIHKFLN